MDAGHSPEAPDGASPAGRSSPAGPRPPGGDSFIGSLLRRATGSLRPAARDDAGPEQEPLGPAFARLSPAERAMVANILRLRDIRVADVMTPRADIVAVPVDAPLEDVMAALARGSLSRVPVYQETLDDPLGFVHLKDLAIAYGVGCAREHEAFDLRRHLRTALFVPPSMRIAALLQKMQAERVHMALVIDEFGGVDGLLTIEDLVEQVVGDIEDEHDDEETEQWRAERPGVWVVDARADIEEFSAATGADLLPEDWEEEADTLGGLAFMLTGRVPTRGEVIAHPLGHEFEIIDADPRRIRRMRLTLHGTAQPEPPAPRPAGRPAAEPGQDPARHAAE